MGNRKATSKQSSTIMATVIYRNWVMLAALLLAINLAILGLAVDGLSQWREVLHQAFQPVDIYFSWLGLKVMWKGLSGD